jgi:Tfp pilus assembly protein PilX
MTGERGMALPLALMALVVIAALIAASFSGAVLEQRLGRGALSGVQVAGAAEAGAAATVGQWQALGLDLLAPGQTAALPTTSLPGRVSSTGSVRRLNSELYLVRVEAIRSDADGAVLARRGSGLVVRVRDSMTPGLLPVVPLPGRGWLRRAWD